MSFYDCNATNLQIIHFLRVRFAKYSFLELFFSGDTPGIIQGAGSNESVENTCTRNKVETTVSGNNMLQDVMFTVFLTILVVMRKICRSFIF